MLWKIGNEQNSKYGHKDTGDLERDIRRLHNEKKDLLKREQKIMKKMKKIGKKDNS